MQPNSFSALHITICFYYYYFYSSFIVKQAHWHNMQIWSMAHCGQQASKCIHYKFQLRKEVYVSLCGLDFVHINIIVWQSIGLPHIPLYCTSNFSLLSVSFCALPSPPLSRASHWRLRIALRAGMPIYGVWQSQVHQANVGKCDL